LKIGGLIKNSFVDYPGKIAAVIFGVGCNFDCWYCHNRELLSKKETLDTGEVLDFLYMRRGQLDAVVFSGGEVCLQDGLADLMGEVKSMGYLIKLDTNGAYPDVLKDLIQKELLDYIAMDVKAPLDKYKVAVCVDADINAIQESIKILLSLCHGDTVPDPLGHETCPHDPAPDYEFRTTCIPQLTIDDIEGIAKTIAGARRYALQQYKHHKTSNKIIGMKYKPHTKAFFDTASAVAEKYIQKVIIRGI